MLLREGGGSLELCKDLEKSQRNALRCRVLSYLSMNRCEGSRGVEEVVDRESCSISLTECPLDGHWSAHDRSLRLDWIEEVEQSREASRVECFRMLAYEGERSGWEIDDS